MELQYIKAIKQNGLKISDLPEDAQTGISEINKVLKGFAMIEKRGLKPTLASTKKLKTLDKWVYYEILDYLHDTDKNDDEMPLDAEDVLDDDSFQKTPSADPTGIRIEAELDALYASGKRSFTIDEIKNSARMAYKEIWDAYEPGDDNGIQTSKYSFLENDNDLFELKIK
jgi:hypothetical protein